MLGEMVVGDRTGRVVKTIGQPAISLMWPRFSPDGRRIVAALSDDSAARDLYTFDVATGSKTRLTFGSSAAFPRWAPGDRVLFESGAPGTSAPSSISLVSAVGGGKPETLVSGVFDPDISSDGRWLVYYRPTRERGADILALRLDPKSLRPVDGERERPVVASPGNEYKPAIHPTSTFLAYLGADSGRFELYLTRFPDGEGKWQVTSGGVDYAMWTPAGDGLLYAQGGRVMEVPIALRPSVVIGTPRIVLESVPTRALLAPTFDMTRDGKTIVFIRQPFSAGEAPGTITVVQNWVVEFEQRGVKN
jgi:serine/threonine-protein kinase